MSKNMIPCRAKDPKTCPYHGAELRMDEAVRQGDFDGYYRFRAHMEDAANKSDEVKAFLKAQPPVKAVQTLKVEAKELFNLVRYQGREDMYTGAEGELETWLYVDDVEKDENTRQLVLRREKDNDIYGIEYRNHSNFSYDEIDWDNPFYDFIYTQGAPEVVKLEESEHVSIVKIYRPAHQPDVSLFENPNVTP